MNDGRADEEGTRDIGRVDEEGTGGIGRVDEEGDEDRVEERRNSEPTHRGEEGREATVGLARKR